MNWDERRATSSRRTNQPPRIFNLDVHASVIADVAIGLKETSATLQQWSISHGNRHFRRFFKIDDPVDVVHANSWRGLDERMIDEFRDRYGRFLSTFDGFIATYPPAFAQLYQGLGKPILVMAATRYEVPFTSRPDDWARLDSFLRHETEAGRLLLAANNRGDRDYLRYFTGLTPEYVASVCDYTGARWQPCQGPRVFFCRSESLSARIVGMSNGQWLPVRKALGRHHSWGALAQCSEVLVIPYNISTMSLFELATAGVPVVVPAPNLMKELAKEHDGVLSELSFAQVEGLNPERLAAADPNNYASPGFLDWWLERADFYDTALMPNVRRIESLRELAGPQTGPWNGSPAAYLAAVAERNTLARESRSRLVRDFVSRL